MPTHEHFYQPRPFDAPPTDYGELGTQPPTSPCMERVVTKLAEAQGVDLAQLGAQFTLERPDQSQQWMITSLDDQRIGVTRFQVDEENLLSPDIDVIFAITEYGWEPREIVHAESPWDEFAQAAEEQGLAVFDAQGNLRYDMFTEFWAQKLEPEGGLAEGSDVNVAVDMTERQFWWRRDLSENAQRLYFCLICERGDVDTLPEDAVVEEFDLHTALKELRSLNLIDESNPCIIKLTRSKSS